jgi:hypothetical protein
MARLLYLAAVFEQVDLPLHFVVDGLLHEAKAVQVLDLAPRAEGRARPAHRDVGVAAKTPFLHVAVADVEPDHQRVQRLGVLHRLDARTHLGLGDDLEQRRAGAIEVDAGPGAGKVERRAVRPAHALGFAAGDAVDRFAGVLLEMGARQVDAMRHFADEEIKRAALHHRRFVLADLVALGQVGIEVVLAREDRHRRDRRADGEAEANRALDGTAVGHGQGAGQRQVDGRGLRVRRRAEGGRGAAEDLRSGRQLGMRLDADHDLVAADKRRRCSGRHARCAPAQAAVAGARRCQSVTCWKACAACSRVASSK